MEGGNVRRSRRLEGSKQRGREERIDNMILIQMEGRRGSWIA